MAANALVPGPASLGRLTDDQILEIFARVTAGHGPQSPFLRSYAETLRCAPRRDFYILRPVSLVLIAKYHLQLGGGV